MRPVKQQRAAVRVEIAERGAEDAREFAQLYQRQERAKAAQIPCITLFFSLRAVTVRRRDCRRPLARKHRHAYAPLGSSPERDRA